jgi:hypothetical protein
MNQSLTGDRLRRRLKTIGLGESLSRQLSSRVTEQIRHMGPEGATEYLKRCGDALLHHMNGTPAKPKWVKTIAGFPKFFTGCEDLPTETLIRLAKLARVVRLSAVSAKQCRKVRDAVEATYRGGNEGLAEMTRLISLGLSFYSFDKPENRPELQNFAPVRPVGRIFRKVQSTSGSTDHTGTPDLVTPVKVLRNVPELRALPYWRDLFFPVSPITLDEIFHPDRNRDKGHAVGEIHAAQEGGAKLRMFASPYTVVQELLYPIHHWIADNFNKLVPTICTYDQKSGADWAQEKLAHGNTVYSWDLSTATCRFPLYPQLEMLRIIGLPYVYIDSLRWACRGKWKVGHELISHFDRREMAWIVGQPLGIAPSMSMFTLCHAMLLTGISRSIGRLPENVFRVLGDDVVISDEMVSSEYRRVLELCDVSISYNKSHASKEFAEFAGYNITAALQVRPGQYRQAIRQNFLSLVEEFESPLSDEVAPWMQQVANLRLFQLGKFDPPPSEWNTYLKANTIMAVSSLENWMIAQAPLWTQKIQQEYTDQWSVHFPGLVMDSGWFNSLKNYTGGRAPIAFYFPNLISVWKTVFSPLKDHYDDDVVMAFMGSSQFMSGEAYSFHAMNAITCAFSLYERMIIDLEQASDLVDKIIEKVNGLLWLPPSNAATTHVLLRRLRASLLTSCSTTV